MRLCFLADLRSPIAVQWIRYFVERGHDVQAISSYPVSVDIIPGARVYTVPLVLARPHLRGSSVHEKGAGRGHIARLIGPRPIAIVRSRIGPYLARRRGPSVQSLITEHGSELLHAMRIPFEGMAAAWVDGPPVVLSVWGNDFTLFANRTSGMARGTRRALRRSDAIHCDCQRDARLVRQWGFPSSRPVWVLPGNGGVDESLFFPGPSHFRQRVGIPEASELLVNPRGIREYVRTDVFFRALSEVLPLLPRLHVACPGMKYSHLAHSLVERFRLGGRVHLLPTLDRHDMAAMFRASRVHVSLSTHDGTPNSLLEGMACGSFPVVSDVESVGEWVAHGDNGLIVPPDKSTVLAAALLRAFTDDRLLHSARLQNFALVRERASYRRWMPRVEEYYEGLIARGRAS